MPESINAGDLRQLLNFVADRIALEESHLNALDSAIGDGDHGITIKLGFEAVRNRLSEIEATTVSTILDEAGNAFMGATGGAIGIIMGKMLMDGGVAVGDASEIGAEEFRTLLKGMESAIVRAGKARPGDKTILDAVAAAARAAASTGPQATLSEVVARASTAAEIAARNTAGMLCRIGRASKLGDRALGHPDPGATSFAVIMRAITEWLGNRRAPAQLERRERQ